MPLVIKTDGTVEQMSDKPELDALQTAVGGYIALVMLEEPRYDDEELVSAHMYANDEGLLMGLPFNLLASQISGQHLVGDVVVIGKTFEQTILEGGREND